MLLFKTGVLKRGKLQLGEMFEKFFIGISGNLSFSMRESKLTFKNWFKVARMIPFVVLEGWGKIICPTETSRKIFFGTPDFLSPMNPKIPVVSPRSEFLRQTIDPTLNSMQTNLCQSHTQKNLAANELENSFGKPPVSKWYKLASKYSALLSKWVNSSCFFL